MRRVAVMAAVGALLSGVPSAPKAQELSGDVRLACEAILCLSSAVQPSACAAALARYFGISFRLMSDTIRGRINFLKLCPVVSAPAGGGAADMPALVEAIGNGAGYCNAEYLNAMTTSVEVKDCPKDGLRFGYAPRDDGGILVTRAVVGYAPDGVPASVDVVDTTGTAAYVAASQDGGDGCVSRTVAVVPSRLPSYCVSYTSNPLTYGLGLTYSGNPLIGGQWTGGR
jgi:hypothetical protein